MSDDFDLEETFSEKYKREANMKCKNCRDPRSLHDREDFCMEFMEDTGPRAQGLYKGRNKSGKKFEPSRGNVAASMEGK